MPIDTPLEEYTQHLEYWQRCRDTIAGEDAVKKAGEKYLPKLGGQEPEEYNAYKMRAMFVNGVGRTVDGLVGAIFRKTPKVDPPNEFIEHIDQEVLEEVVSVGRVGILAEAPRAELGGGEPYPVLYYAEQIINWRYTVVGTSKQLTLVILRESAQEPDPDDLYKTVSQTRYRVLELVAGIYRQQEWIEQTVNGKTTLTQISEVFPLARNQPLDYIPFQFINAADLDPDADMPPLLDLVNVNLSHYRTSADLEHGRHFTALPTAWVAGFDTGSTDLRIGAGTAWISNDPNAKAGFLEFTGQGLGALERGMEEKAHYMGTLGARLMETPQKGVEAEGTARLRQTAETATIVSMSKNVSTGLTHVYQWLNAFKAGPQGTGTGLVELSTDVIDANLNAQQVTALVAAYQAGAMSLDALLWNFERAEMLPDNTTIEQEKLNIQKDHEDAMSRMMDQAAGMADIAPPVNAPPNGSAQ